MAKWIFTSLVVLGLAACGAGDSVTGATDPFPELRGDYLGQPRPGAEPRLFAPGIVSTGLDTRDLTMTPDGNEIYFSVFAASRAMIVVSKRVGGLWSPPEIAPFSGKFQDIEPCISPDGSRFFFMSTRPKAGEKPTEGWVRQDLWMMDRVGDGWGPPRPVGPPVNSDAPEYFPSVTADGTLYFTREADDGISFTYRSRWVDGRFEEPERLPEQVNLGTNRFNVFIDPAERFAIVPAVGGPGSIGGADYYLVRRNPDDTWRDPRILGPAINRETGKEWSASLSPDGTYLFFMSTRVVDSIPPTFAGMPLRSLADRSSEPGRGASGIWWVEAEAVLGSGDLQ